MSDCENLRDPLWLGWHFLYSCCLLIFKSTVTHILWQDRWVFYEAKRKVIFAPQKEEKAGQILVEKVLVRSKFNKEREQKELTGGLISLMGSGYELFLCQYYKIHLAY